MSEGGRYLLDTHVFIWLASDESQVGQDLRDRISDPSADLFLSVASIWEMAIKRSLGKLSLEMPLGEFVSSQLRLLATEPIDIRPRHALMVEALPFHHRDPFDRLLIVQAMAENLEIISRDSRFDAYGIRRIW